MQPRGAKTAKCSELSSQASLRGPLADLAGTSNDSQFPPALMYALPIILRTRKTILQDARHDELACILPLCGFAKVSCALASFMPEMNRRRGFQHDSLRLDGCGWATSKDPVSQPPCLPCLFGVRAQPSQSAADQSCQSAKTDPYQGSKKAGRHQGFTTGALPAVNFSSREGSWRDHSLLTAGLSPARPGPKICWACHLFLSLAQVSI